MTYREVSENQSDNIIDPARGEGGVGVRGGSLGVSGGAELITSGHFGG